MISNSRRRALGKVDKSKMMRLGFCEACGHWHGPPFREEDYLGWCDCHLCLKCACFGVMREDCECSCNVVGRLGTAECDCEG